jgi:hypothetical protein
MTLADTQAQLFSALVTGGEPLSALAGLLTPLPAATLRRRLDVYAETLRYKTGNRLASFYTRTTRLLSRERFQDVVDGYLAEAGTELVFSRLVEGFPEYFDRLERPWIRPETGALARVERARNQVAEEPRQAALTLQALLAVPPTELDGLRLTMVSALRVFETPCDTTEIWHSLESATEPPPAGCPSSQPVMHLAWASGEGVLHRVLDPCEAAALTCALTGATLAEVCTHFEHATDQAAAAHAALQGWFDDGLVLALHSPCVH